MSLARSLSLLRSLSPKLPRYSVFYCYERLSSSSGGCDEPRRGGDWVVLLSEEKLKRKLDAFWCEFKELREKVKLIQNVQPIGLRFTPDWVLLYEQEFEKQFDKFLSDYKQFKDESLQKSGMQPMFLKSEDLARTRFEKQLGCYRLVLKGSKDINAIIQSILFDINYEMRLVALKYSSIINNMSTSDTMKELKNIMNVLKDLYRKLGKSILEHPDEYFRFHDECSATTQKLISVLAFIHWMETGSLLVKSTAEEKMGFEPLEFDLDPEDYLLGLCIMSNDLTKYASNLYLSEDHDSLRNIAAFMINMEETICVLFLSNDKLHERLEGLKHNVKRVQDMLVAGRLLKE